MWAPPGAGVFLASAQSDPPKKARFLFSIYHFFSLLFSIFGECVFSSNPIQVPVSIFMFVVDLIFVPLAMIPHPNSHDDIFLMPISCFLFFFFFFLFWSRSFRF